MSRKDYELIAGALRTIKTDALCTLGGAAEQSRDIWLGHVVERLSNAFTYDNPRFSRERFVKACEEGTR